MPDAYAHITLVICCVCQPRWIRPIAVKAERREPKSSRQKNALRLQGMPQKKGGEISLC